MRDSCLFVCAYETLRMFRTTERLQFVKIAVLFQVLIFSQLLYFFMIMGSQNTTFLNFTKIFCSHFSYFTSHVHIIVLGEI